MPWLVIIIIVTAIVLSVILIIGICWWLKTRQKFKSSLPISSITAHLPLPPPTIDENSMQSTQKCEEKFKLIDTLKEKGEVSIDSTMGSVAQNSTDSFHILKTQPQPPLSTTRMTTITVPSSIGCTPKRKITQRTEKELPPSKKDTPTKGVATAQEISDHNRSDSLSHIYDEEAGRTPIGSPRKIVNNKIPTNQKTPAIQLTPGESSRITTYTPTQLTETI